MSWKLRSRGSRSPGFVLPGKSYYHDPSSFLTAVRFRLTAPIHAISHCAARALPRFDYLAFSSIWSNYSRLMRPLLITKSSDLRKWMCAASEIPDHRLVRRGRHAGRSRERDAFQTADVIEQHVDVINGGRRIKTRDVHANEFPVASIVRLAQRNSIIVVARWSRLADNRNCWLYLSKCHARVCRNARTYDGNNFLFLHDFLVRR